MTKLNKMNQYNPMAAPTGGRQGDPKPSPIRPLRSDLERTTFTTDPGAAGQVNWPSMYDLSRSLTAGKWGKGGKWK